MSGFRAGVVLIDSQTLNNAIYIVFYTQLKTLIKLIKINVTPEGIVKMTSK